MDYKQKGFWIFKIIAKSWVNASYYVAWYDLFRMLWNPFDIYVILIFNWKCIFDINTRYLLERVKETINKN